jgi:protein-S-isoprenylcysteine O-methyltransferase Ste14
MPGPDLLYRVTFTAVIACWFAFLAAFLLMRLANPRPAEASEKKRDNRARIGILVEALAYAAVWSFRRHDQPLLFPGGGTALAVLLSVLAIILALLSLWMVVTALRTLGKQWAVAARVLEGHELITSGPYRLVRNPIYAGMFGMLIATGIAASHWWALGFAMLLFWYGTDIRIKAEERLLRETFGEKFDQYSKDVPPLIPGFR